MFGFCHRVLFNCWFERENKQIKHMMRWNNVNSFQGYVTMTMTSHCNVISISKQQFPTIRHHFVINPSKDLNVISSTFVILLLLSENTTSSCVFMHAPGINHLLQILLYDNCQIFNVKVKYWDINFWPHCCFLLFATFPGHKYVFLDIVSLSTHSLTFFNVGILFVLLPHFDLI